MIDEFQIKNITFDYKIFIKNMEIEIKNFGPIDSLKFNLNKDLHLIYGQNAIGKSYATYCLYCFN